LDNFLANEDFLKIISDSTITEEEARQIIGGTKTRQIEDPNNPGQYIDVTSTERGIFDKQFLEQLKLSEESNKQVREELIKFLRSLDKDNLLNLSYN